ncbi:MAG: Gfo/Idh/MocA family protein [Bacteroidota bacterium]
MSKEQSKNLSRRHFLRNSMIGAAGLTILPGFKAFSANNTITLGFIGVGRQAMYLLDSFLGIDGVKVLACSDVYGVKRKRFEKRVKDFYSKKGETIDVKTYEHYQDVLSNPEIDAVVIATPDHWHALIAIDACKAGKDIYLEKPLTFTIEEGKRLRKAVRKYDRILAVGSQQRSDPAFQHAVKLVQDGKLGELEKINAYIGAPPTPYDLPKEIIPVDLNYDLWLGPNPYVQFNHVLNPPISLNPPKDEQIWGAWRWYRELGGGFTTDWGAHMFDIAQWAMGMDDSGPVKIIPEGYEGAEAMTFVYGNGVKMYQQPFNEEMTKGVKFWGSDGWIEVARGYFKASDKRLLPDIEEEKGPYETKIPHQLDFIAAIRERRDPRVSVETGHRTCTTCTLGNIAHELGRPVQWNPQTEEFVEDPQADLYMHREYRKGYNLPVL